MYVANQVRVMDKICDFSFVFENFSMIWNRVGSIVTLRSITPEVTNTIWKMAKKYAQAKNIPYTNQDDTQLMIGTTICYLLSGEKDFRDIFDKLESRNATAKEYLRLMIAKWKHQEQIINIYTQEKSSNVAAYITEVAAHGERIDNETNADILSHPYIHELGMQWANKHNEFHDFGFCASLLTVNTLLTDNRQSFYTSDNIFLPKYYIIKEQKPIMYRSNVFGGRRSSFVAKSDFIQNCIETAKKLSGDVLVLGDNFGLLTYEAAQNPNVDSIIVAIENPEFADFFKKEIIPLFNTTTPVNVVCGSSQDVIHNTEDSMYDYIVSCNIEQNHSVALYFKEKSLLSKYSKTKTMFLSEKTFAERQLLPVMDDVIVRHFDENILERDPDNDVIPHYKYPESEWLDMILENEEITRPEHVDWYMNPNNLIDVINKNI